MTYQRPSHLETRAGAPLRWAASLAFFLIAGAHPARAGVNVWTSDGPYGGAAVNPPGTPTNTYGPSPTPTATPTATSTPTVTPTPACAPGIVGIGTAASCTESSLDACLPGGRCFTGAVTFTAQNLNIANGFSAGGGGGIANADGTVTVTNSTFSGNTASGAYGIGGAIFNASTLTVTNSTFSGNSASVQGGGIGNFGTLTVTVTNSTFFGNSAGASGAGNGGGISNTGTLTVTNSTFSGNTAGGAGGGGIGNYGTAALTNTIIANSTQGGNCAGTITDGGHNLDSDGTCVGAATDPLLAPAGLASNGGPTQTIALLPGSPAINAGDPEVCANPPVNGFDQRGYVRPGVGHAQCAIGAYEADAVPPPPTARRATIAPARSPTAGTTSTPMARAVLVPQLTRCSTRRGWRTTVARPKPSRLSPTARQSTLVIRRSARIRR